jgi:hypothetical protein
MAKNCALPEGSAHHSCQTLLTSFSLFLYMFAAH